MSIKTFKITCMLTLCIVLSSCGDSSSNQDDKNSKLSFINTSCEDTWTRYYSMFSIPINWTAIYSNVNENSGIELKYTGTHQGENVSVESTEIGDDESNTENMTRSDFISQCNLIKRAYTEQNDVYQEVNVEGKEALHIATTISKDLALQLVNKRDDASAFSAELSQNPDSTIHFIADVTYDGFILNENIYFDNSSGEKFSNVYKVKDLKM